MVAYNDTYECNEGLLDNNQYTVYISIILSYLLELRQTVYTLANITSDNISHALTLKSPIIYENIP